MDNTEENVGRGGISEDTQVSPSSGADPADITLEIQDGTGRGLTPGAFLTRLRARWQPVLIVILLVLSCAVVSALFSLITKQQSLTAELQNMPGERSTAWNKTKRLQNEINHLKQLLNSTYQNFSILGDEHSQLKLLINVALHNVTLLSAEKAQLSRLLNNTLEEKTQLQVENRELNIRLNTTVEDYILMEEENRRLDELLNKSLHVITEVSAESERLSQLLNNEQQISVQLEAKNQQQHSILFSDKLSFLWRFCNKDTLQCSSCLPGWVEHDSRCFFLSTEEQKWENARRECIDMGSDLAVVLNAEDQAFLTNMTFQFVQKYPETLFHSAWIGLQDMVREGTFFWVNGDRVRSDVKYWMPNEPNNAIASWDIDRAGQDCVAIVPPTQIGAEGWLNSWDDIVCVGARHYLCGTKAFILS